MANTDFASIKAENTDVNFQDHNGNLEIIPLQDEYMILNYQQAAEMIKILSKWLADSVCNCQEAG